MRKKINIEEAIRRISDRLDEHIGANGKYAHLGGDIDRPGFITPEQVQSIQQSLGNRDVLEDGTDILTLAPGHYYGQNLVNSSWPKGTSGITLVDVEEASDDVKQYCEIESVNGGIHVYTLHKNDAGTNVNAPNSWTTINRHLTLWEGNASAVGTKINLTDNAWKYRRLNITFDNQNKGKKTVTVEPQGGWTAVTDTQNYNGDNYVSSFEMELLFSDDSCEIKGNTLYVVGKGTLNATTTGELALVQIEGVA